MNTNENLGPLTMGKVEINRDANHFTSSQYLAAKLSENTLLLQCINQKLDLLCDVVEQIANKVK